MFTHSRADVEVCNFFLHWCYVHTPELILNCAILFLLVYVYRILPCKYFASVCLQDIALCKYFASVCLQDIAM